MMIKKTALFLILMLTVILCGCAAELNSGQEGVLTVAGQNVPRDNLKQEDISTENRDSDSDEGDFDESSESNDTEEIRAFSKEEWEKFQLIEKYYPEFQYSTLYHYTDRYDKEMIFEKEDNIYLGFYNSYVVIYHVEGMVEYYFDAGTGWRGFGAYYIFDNDVIKIQEYAGEYAYGYDIYKNGKKIDGGEGLFPEK